MVEALFTKVMSSQCKDKSLRTTHVGLMIFISLLSVGVSGIRTPSCCCLLKLLLEWAKIHFNRQFPGPWAVLRVEDWTKVLFSCRDRRAQQQDRRISFECARHRRAWGHSRPLLIWGCCEDCFFCCCYSTITGCFISILYLSRRHGFEADCLQKIHCLKWTSLSYPKIFQSITIF